MVSVSFEAVLTPFLCAFEALVAAETNKQNSFFQSTKIAVPATAVLTPAMCEGILISEVYGLSRGEQLCSVSKLCEKNPVGMCLQKKIPPKCMLFLREASKKVWTLKDVCLKVRDMHTCICSS